METEISYLCPNCSTECTVPESMVGQNVACPSCSAEFFATPPLPVPVSTAADGQTGFSLPAKLPFFKSGRRRILEQRFEQIVAAGKLGKEAYQELDKLATVLGLGEKDVSDIRNEQFLREFNPIKKQMEASFLMTDDDQERIAALQKKYDIELTLGGDGSLFRAIYLLESTGELPSPIDTGLMLSEGEVAYFTIETTWHQARVHTRGYSGVSVSVPTGVKGVRFRFGGYTPNRTEELTPLSSGTLYITSDRLLFNGDTRNTTIPLKKIVDGHVFADALKVEKGTGKPDFFSMTAPYARYVLSLVGALKSL
jgi:DNA-directed RNA polymerase subunit RPC12/RpoP